jgi:hypothetical protein
MWLERAVFCWRLHSAYRYKHLTHSNRTGILIPSAAVNKVRPNTCEGCRCQYGVGIDAYAGDVSSMFDKLPCSIFMDAVEWALNKALDTVTPYHLRSTGRSFITINLSDKGGHRIGRAYDGEGIITISFSALLSVCRHCCFHTYHGTSFSLTNISAWPWAFPKEDPFRIRWVKCSACTANTNGCLLFLATPGSVPPGLLDLVIWHKWAYNCSNL